MVTNQDKSKPMSLDMEDSVGVTGRQVQELIGRSFIHFRTEKRYSVIGVGWEADTDRWTVLHKDLEAEYTISRAYKSFTGGVLRYTEVVEQAETGGEAKKL